MVTREHLQQLLVDTLPTADLIPENRAALEEAIRHALFLQESSPYCRDIPPDRFLHFVFYPRVHSEALCLCREFFYAQLAPRIAGMTGTEAALEVNRWCAEHVTYAASDDRTESPMTAYLSGKGRCGEESAFCVSAMRAVGIPARQVYVPWWAHCDDNHAWVEIFVDGCWHFLGACEPEPILDRGWFLDAAERASMVHYRTWFDCAEGDPIVGREGCVQLYSVLPRYADTAMLHIQAPANAAVQICVANMAAFRPVANGTGCMDIALGKGSYHIEAHLNGLLASKEVVLCSADTWVSLVPEAPEAREYTVDCIAPAVSHRVHPLPTEEAAAQNRRVLEQCRAAWAANHPVPETDDPILRAAGHNRAQIAAFLEKRSPDELPLARELLLALPAKDLKDITAGLLEHHWQAALPYRAVPGFVSQVLNPRVATENLSLWRGLPAADTPPEELYAQLAARYPDKNGRYSPTAWLTPETIIRTGMADEKSRKLLLIALLRSRGIPASLNPVDGQPDYGIGTQRRTAAVKLTAQEGFEPAYGGNYSIARLEPDGFRVLGPVWGHIALQPGFYRVMLTNRLPNGNQLCSVREFPLAEADVKELRLQLRTAKPEQMLADIRLEPFALEDPNGRMIPSNELLSGKTMVIYLQTGQEPTAHILNELLENQSKLDSLQLILIPGSPEQCSDPLLKQITNRFPKAALLFDHGNAEVHARKLFLEPGVYPLMLLADETHRSYYGTCGYNVGSVELARKLAEFIPQ